jgi:uncharacterized protein YbaR (Trm112 family)
LKSWFAPCARGRSSGRRTRELICKADRLAFPVKDGIPVMLEDEARTLRADEEP